MDRLADWPERMRRLIGGRGLALFAVGVLSAVLLSLIELAYAVFLLLFLHSLHLVGAAQLPAWIPPRAATLPPAAVWLALLGLGALQAAGLLVHYEAKGLLTEGAQVRLRLALGYRTLLARKARAMPLSEMNLYTAEFFPKTASFVFYANQLMSFAVQAALLSAWMLLLAPGEALVGLAGLGVMGLLVLRLNRHTHRLGGQVPRAQEDLERTKVRITRNWLLIRLFRIQEREFGNWVRATLDYRRFATLSFRFGSLSAAAMPLFGIIVLAAIVLANAKLFHTPVATLMAFLYLFVRFEQMVANGSSLMGGLFTYRTQVQKATDFLLSFPEAELREAFRAASGPWLRRPGTAAPRVSPPPGVSRAAPGVPVPPPAIDVDHVGFAWPGHDTPVLTDVSLRIAPGEQVGIVGPNGCGKSTLLGLLLGALEPASGTVRIDNRPAAAFVGDSARAIAYVGPDPYLIRGSVRDNLLYGCEEPGDEASLWRALAKVGMEDAIRALPGGLAYRIEEDGAGLSSGQKQRLAMARGFLRQPALFVMDEPSANLDAATEQSLLQGLRELRGRCTVIVVSHRAGILRDVDRTFEMDAAARGVWRETSPARQ